MITIYKTCENGLETINEPLSGSWISVIDPTTVEIEQIQGLGVPQDFITYPLDLDERPRTEREDDGTLLVVLRIPFYQGAATDVPHITIPLGVILTSNLIVTVCRRQNDILTELASPRLRGLSTTKRNRFLLRIMLNAANKYLSYLREINKSVDMVEDKLTTSMRNREVLELLKYQKSLVYFATALKSNELLLERLQRSRLFKLYPDDEDLLDDVIIENQQAIEMTNIANNILSSMMDAFASLISNNLNVVMKFLASVTIVLSLSTIITGFFGMNVDIPYITNNNEMTIRNAYLMILMLMLVVSSIVVYVFAKRDWF